MRIADVLGHNVAWLALDLLLLSDDLDATTTGRSTRLHDVHVLVIVSLSVHAELAIVIWEQVRLRAEVEFLKDAPHPADILPHHVLASDLERLWEMIELLVLGRFFEVLWFGLACPLYVPLGAVWTHYAEAGILQSVHH